jgi:putative transcriptional regulator
MGKRQYDLLETLRSGLRDYGDHKSGTRLLKQTKVSIPPPDVKAIRAKLSLSQQEFAARFGLSVSTIRNWEQRVREPDQPGALLLHLISKFPAEIAQEVERLKHVRS